MRILPAKFISAKKEHDGIRYIIEKLYENNAIDEMEYNERVVRLTAVFIRDAKNGQLFPNPHFKSACELTQAHRKLRPALRQREIDRDEADNVDAKNKYGKRTHSPICYTEQHCGEAFSHLGQAQPQHH